MTRRIRRAAIASLLALAMGTACAPDRGAMGNAAGRSDNDGSGTNGDVSLTDVATPPSGPDASMPTDGSRDGQSSSDGFSDDRPQCHATVTDDDVVVADTDPSDAGPCPVCPDDKRLCLDGVCAACFPGASTCAGNTPRRCDAKGQWQDAPTGPCTAPNATCVNGACMCSTVPNPDSGPANCGQCGRGCLGAACVNFECEPIQLGDQSYSASQIAVDGTNVYWVGMHHGVSQVSIDGGTPTVIYEADPPAIAAGVTLIADGTYVYWANGSAIVRIDPTGGPSLELLSRPSETIAGIAMDATFVYWGTATGTIGKIGVDGGMPIVLAHAQGAVDHLAVDATDLYWGASDRTADTGAVMRMSLSGAAPPTLIDCSTTVLQLELTKDSVVWSNNVGITSIPKRGGAPSVLVQAYPYRSGFYGFGVDDTYVYWFNDTGLMKIPVDASQAYRERSGYSGRMAVDAEAIYWIRSGVNGTASTIWKRAK